MTYLTAFLVVIGIAFGFLLGRRSISNTGEEIRNNSSIAKARQAKQEQKDKDLQRILDHMDSGRTTNNQVQELLGVSDSTATRYMDELEKRGQVVQKGKGSAAYYERSAQTAE